MEMLESGTVAFRGLSLFLVTIALSSPRVEAHPITEVFERVKDSVVVIATTERDLPPFPGGQATSVGGLGSGVLIDGSGLVLTAAHVVQVAEEIEVSFTSGEVIRAEVQGSVPAADLALLHLERVPKNAVAATLGNSDEAEVGDQIFIIGAPHGISHTLTVGHISARRVSDNLFGGFVAAEMLQTDAAINVGNSGGPMFDMQGRVIGIVSHMISESGSYEGLGFVMTSNMARELLLEQRSIWTGVEAQLVSGPLASALNLPQDFGILVQRVAEGSLAAHMGLRAGTLRAEIEGEPIVLGGDVILAIEGIRLTDVGAALRIRSLLRSLSPGAEVDVTVLRDGQQIDLTTVPTEP
jgi:S1-C subfamily serine protease